MDSPEDHAGRMFVEIKQITIRNRRGKSRHSVMIKHKTGATESFSSERKQTEAKLTCGSLVECGCPETQLYVSRSSKPEKSTPIALEIQYDARKGNELAVPFPIDQNMSVTLTLSTPISEAEAINARLQAASSAMDNALSSLNSKEQMMKWLNVGTMHLGLLVSLGSSAAELNDATRMVSGITKELFQRIGGMSAVHMELLRTVVNCNRHFDTVIKDARAKFTSESARRTLDEWIWLVIRAAKEIQQAYAEPGLALAFKQIWSPKTGYVMNLRQELSDCKNSMTHAFLVEIRDVVGNMKNDADDARSREQEEKDSVLMAKLLPPDSSSFEGKARCLAGTRENVLEIINEWIYDADKPSRFYWLYGVAGCGKSTVAASICRTLDSKRQLIGSFFCWRDQVDRRNPVRLIRSIAFYLAKANPAFRAALLDELRDLQVFSSPDPSSQFERLIERPANCKDVKATTYSDTAVFVIDGLDELDSNGILSELLIKLINLVPWVLVIVASRRHTEIENGLSDLHDLKDELNLYDKDAHDDIITLIKKELATGGRLYDVHEYLENRVDELADRSQGLFIWIEVVIKFLEADAGNISTVQKLIDGGMFAEAEIPLDVLYRAVIDYASRISKMAKEVVKLILGFMVSTSETTPMDARTIHAFLPQDCNITFQAFETILKRLGAILVLHDEGITVVHASVLDFASDTNRCGDKYFIPRGEIECMIALGSLEIMERGTRNESRRAHSPRGLHFNMCNLETSYLPNKDIPDFDNRVAANISRELRYSCKHWPFHVERCSTFQSDTISRRDLEAISSHVNAFFTSPLSLFWIEGLGLTGGIYRGYKGLPVFGESTSTIFKPFIDIAKELRSFLQDCALAIEHCTPHLYLSLAYFPPDARFWTSWRNNFLVPHILERVPREITPSSGHHDLVTSVAFSPDGQRIASSSYDCTVRVWNVHSGEPVSTAEMTCPDVPWSVQFSPDGGMIASLGYQGALRLWDAQSGLLLSAMEGHTGKFPCLAFSPVGKQIATGSGDNTVCLWDVSTAQQIGETLEGHQGAVNGVAFSPDGELIASASEDTTIRVWDSRSKKARGDPFQGHTHTGSIRSIAFSPDATRIASGGHDGTIRLWDVQRQRSIGDPLEGHDGPIPHIQFARDGLHLYSYSEESSSMSIRRWNVGSGASVYQYSVDFNSTWTMSPRLSVSPDEIRIVTASGHSIRMWDTQTFSLEVQEDLPSCGLRGPHKLLANVEEDGWVRKDNGDLLLWIPGRFRGLVGDISIYCISNDENVRAGPIRIHWDKLCHGESWTSVWKGTAPTVSLL